MAKFLIPPNPASMSGLCGCVKKSKGKLIFSHLYLCFEAVVLLQGTSMLPHCPQHCDPHTACGVADLSTHLFCSCAVDLPMEDVLTVLEPRMESG